MQPPENAADWFRVENSVDEDDATDVFVYDSIGGWFGMYADEFLESLSQITSSRINLRLNCPGGSVFEGIAIANALRAHPANVTVYVDSLAASIASVIMLAGDRIVMRPQSQVMIHNASGACYGDASEMTKMADLLDKQSRNIAEAYAERTGRPVQEFLDYMAAETWFTAKEAVEVGLADEAMPMKPKKEEECEPMPASASALMNRAWDLSMYRYAGRDNAPDPAAGKAPGVTVLNEMADALQQVADATEPANSAEDKVIIDIRSPEFADHVREMIRQVIRAELAVVEGTAVGSHSTSVEEGTWDAGANEKRLPSPVPVATVRKMYTYYDENEAEDGKVPKSACKLPHHFVSEDGTPGAASINGVRNALARLPQTQGLSDAERKTAEAHLRAHLNAFDGDSEDHIDDDTDAAVTDDPVAADDSPDAATHPSMPPEEEEEETPPEEEEEPNDEADEWDSIVGLLSAPATSPSADDVFAHLKEVW